MVRRNRRVTFSQRMTLHHWLIRTGRSRQDLDPLGVHVADDGLGGRPHGQPLLQLLLAPVVTHATSGAESGDVLGLLRARKLSGINSGK